MDKTTSSPQHPSNQSSTTAPSTWTKDASSWTPSKATSLLPTFLPVSKPLRGWDRVPKAPVAQHSRVKQVWRREYGLRSQPNTEGNGGQGQEDVSSNAQKRSPTRVVKKKRIRSPTKKSVETDGDDEGEPNHAPTRWENRRTSLRRKGAGQQTDTVGSEQHESSATSFSPLQNPVEEMQEAKLQGDHILDTVEGQEKISATTISGKGDPPHHQLTELLPEQYFVTSSSPTLPADELPFESNEAQHIDGLSDNKHAESPTHSMSGSEKDESASGDSPAPEDYYRQGLDEPLETDQTLDLPAETSTLPATILSESSEAAVEKGESVLPQHDEVMYPSLTITDIDRSPRKLRDDLNVNEEIAQKLEAVVESSDLSQLDRAELGNHEALGLQLEQAETILQQTPVKSSDIDQFDITEGLQLGSFSSAKKRTSQSPASILKTISTIAKHDISAQDEESSLLSPDELTMDFDATETLTMGHLEDDKARLRSFLNRAAANKASKVATTHRRESAQSRRDSDVIRQALASPRAVLEEKDTNLSSTRNLDFLTEPTMTLDKIITSPCMSMKRPLEDAELDPIALDSKNDDTMELDLQPGSPRRRSKRTQSRIPHAPSTVTIKTPHKIPVRTDGSERVLLNRTEAQELSNIMRKNTRKNKGAAMSAPERLLKLRAEAALKTITDGGSSAEVTRELKDGAKGVRWREQLVEFSDSVATADLVENATTDTIIPATSGPIESDAPMVKDKQPTPSRLRRLRGLGGTNGTPAKGLLASTLLPDEVEEEAAAKAKATAVPPMAEELKKERKSRLQPPKKLMLNPSVTSLSGLPVLAGKENASLLLSPAKKLGAPAKGKIPVPTATVMGDGTGIRAVKRLRAPRKL